MTGAPPAAQGPPTGAAPDAEYILPLRWTGDTGLADLAYYLHQLSSWIPVTVVDGSDPVLFERHRAAFPAAVRHIRPDHHPHRQDGTTGGAGNGKVAGVMTGVRSSRAHSLVIADDDVRYTREALAAVVHSLGSADVVRPQNYFTPLPWHARWDTARILLNRAWSADYPGTLGVRRDALLGTGGWPRNLPCSRQPQARSYSPAKYTGWFWADWPRRPSRQRKLDDAGTTALPSFPPRPHGLLRSGHLSGPSASGWPLPSGGRAACRTRAAESGRRPTRRQSSGGATAASYGVSPGRGQQQRWRRCRHEPRTAANRSR